MEPRPLWPDTPLEIEEMVLEGLRKMSPIEKIKRIQELNRSVETMAATRIRSQYGPLSERELRLRLAALRLPRDVMISVFDWDPEEHGY